MGRDASEDRSLGSWVDGLISNAFQAILTSLVQVVL